MADGPHRFPQAGTGQYYHQHYNQQVYQHNQNHQRQLARNSSPVNSGRTGYNNDTPSPSRSPVSQAASHNSFSLFNAGHQQGQLLMNGGNGHQRYMPSHMQHHKYPHQSHQQHHNNQQAHHPQNHGAHTTHGAMGHQHSFSSGLMSNPAAGFPSGGLQNGSPNDDQDDMEEPGSEHWQEQLQLAAESRQQSAQFTHRHSKKLGAVVQARGTLQSSVDELRQDGDLTERNRVTNTGSDDRDSWDGIDLSGQGIRVLSPRLFHNYLFLKMLCVDNNKLTSLPSAIGQLKNLEVLYASLNQLRELPDSIGMLYNLKRLMVFDNVIHTLPYEIGHLHRLEMLGIAGNPLEDELKDIIIHQGTQALILHIRDRTEAGPPPRPREIQVIDDSESTESFTVLDYNILCHHYANELHYGYTPTKALSWDYRRELIIQEIKDLDADIVCLQEVEWETFNEFLRPNLAMNDYKGIFWPKSRARTMADREAKMVDGCATFYKGKKFILLDKQLIDFANTAINRPDMKGEHDIFNRVMPRDQIAVLSFFENRMTGSRMIVANTHMFWDPNYTDVKVVQAAILMEQTAKSAHRWASQPPCTDKVAFRYTEQDSENEPDPTEDPPQMPGPSLEYPDGSQIPLVVCGDLNCEENTGVYNFLHDGSLPGDHPDLGSRSYGNFTRNGITHPFNLRSVYNAKEIQDDPEQRLQFTNHTPGYSACIDYIWHSANSLKLKKALGKLDDDYLQKVPGLPNFHFPSDHLALFAEFSVEPRKERPKAVEADFGNQRDRRN